MSDGEGDDGGDVTVGVGVGVGVGDSVGELSAGLGLGAGAAGAGAAQPASKSVTPSAAVVAVGREIFMVPSSPKEDDATALGVQSTRPRSQKSVPPYPPVRPGQFEGHPLALHGDASTERCALEAMVD
jgi:hypothetical protein